MKSGWSKIALATLLFCLLASPALAAEPAIAVAAPLTGPAAAYGDNVKAGVDIKVAEVNAKGGVNGMKFKVEYFDELCDPKEAATVAPKIVRDKNIVAIVGHVCSSAHLAALPTYVRGGVLAISATATNVAISDQNKDKAGKVWSFRDVYRDDFQGKFLARYAKEALGLAKVAVFHENNDYGIGLKGAFVGEAQKIGLEVVGVEAYVKGATDFTPQLTKLKSAAPQGIFLSGYYPEGALIATQAKKVGLDVLKFGADGFDNADYIKLAGDAAGILIQAVAKVGPDRAKVRDYLAAMNTPEKGYKGITGVTYFDAHGDAQKPAFVKMVKGGAFVTAPKQLK